MPDDLSVRGHLIPESALEWRFTPTGGPGGQHANKASTRVELRFDLAASDVFDEELKNRMLPALDTVDGVVIVTADDTRSQWRNRTIARRRLVERLEGSMKRPRRRKATKPTKASKQRRLDQKRHRSETKRLRRSPPE